MKITKGLRLALVATVGLAVSGAVTVTANAASAATTPSFRQLIGTVSGSTDLEVGVPGSGTYAVEYDVTGTAYFDTYVDGTELGYVGGTDGVFQTRTLQLSSSGHLIHVAGPEGSGSATVYLVAIR